MRSRFLLIPTVAMGLFWPLALSAAAPATLPVSTEPATENANVSGEPNEQKQFPLLPAGAPATRPAPEEDTGDEPKLTLDSPSIKSVVKLSLKDKMLAMTTDLPVLEEAARIKIADFPGKTVAVVNNQHEMPVITIRHEISIPPSTSIIYTLSSLQNDVRLSVDSENDREVKSVQYIQSAQNDASDPDDRPVKLYVTVNDKLNNTKPIDLKLQADDVAQLRRKYPRETTEYFQPMLAALGQEEVAFAVEHRVAWQVLRSHFAVDPGTAAQVKKLIVQLDAEDYATRESASDALEKLGEPAALVVLQMPRAALTSEQNSRLDAFLAPYKPLADTEAQTLASDVPFLLDCLYTDNRTMRDVTLDQIRKVSARPIALKTDQPAVAWLASVRQLRKQLLAAPATLAAGSVARQSRGDPPGYNLPPPHRQTATSPSAGVALSHTPHRSNP